MFFDLDHAHAVTHIDGVQKYWYDANGNMTTRIVDGNTYNLAYDAESRLVGVSGAATASFVYDGDGNRVKGVTNGTTTIYIGSYFEWTGTITNSMRYYYAGAQRIAMRIGNNQDTTGLFWISSDHLGSTTVTSDNNGNKYGELRYKAWGENRYINGSLLTKRQYTGQINEELLGLYFYNARWYDPVLGRFVQADTIIPNPGDVQSWDRFAYTLNNPLCYIDPSGYDADCGMWESKACKDSVKKEYILQKQNIINELSDLGWKNYDHRFTLQELLELVNIAHFIAFRIMQLSGRSGYPFIKKYLQASFWKNGPAQKAPDSSSSTSFGGIVPWQNEVYLDTGFTNDTVIHELGHVLDNNYVMEGLFPNTWTGGGPGDALVQFMGGNPESCFLRFFYIFGKNAYQIGIAGNDPWDPTYYGNTGVAEDFAETFKYTILEYQNVPLMRQFWMQAFLSLIG